MALALVKVLVTGESNALWNRDNYHCVFPGMVKDWQVAWTNRSGSSETLRMPFGFVQLAAGARENATVVRFAQTAKYGYVPNPLMPTAFMAAAYGRLTGGRLLGPGRRYPRASR